MEMKKNGSDEKKMKAIMKDMVVGGGSRQGQRTFEVSSCLLLDSKLSNNNDDNEYPPCRKVNLPNYYLNMAGTGGSSSCSHHRHIELAQPEETPPPEPTSTVFTCDFCKRVFSTCQALGGHQNAHKQERAIAKWRKGTGVVGAVGHPSFHPYNVNPYSIGNDSSLINRSPLGHVRMMGSRIHKPSFYRRSSPSTSSLGHRFGHGGWSRASSMFNLQQQPSIVRVNNGVFQTHNNNGRCDDVVGSSASRLVEGSGRSHLDTASSSSAFVATNGASKKATGGDGSLWRNGPSDEKEADDESTEIDLSLRL